MGVGILMNHQAEPILRSDAAHIQQDGDGLQMDIAAAVYAKLVVDGSRQDPYGALLLGVKALVAALE